MDLSALIQSAGQQYNVDPSLIHAVIQTESSGNPNAVGPQTQYGQAEGLGQFIPATAKSLGISNPFDPAQAVPGIAKLLSENLDRYGDVQKAISAYHGGTDPANWGPKTQAYVQKVAANYGGASMPTQQQPQDLPGLPPVNGPQQGMVDPFAKFRGDASQQAQVGVPANSQGMVDPFAKFRGDNGVAPASATSAVPPVMRAPQVQQGPQPGTFESGLGGFGVGVGKTAAGIEQLIGRGASALGANGIGNFLSNDAQYNLDQLNSGYAPLKQAHPFAAGIGNVAGSVASTAPLAMVAPTVGATGLTGLLARTGIGAGIGAANGAISPVDNPGNNFWQQKGGQIGLNAAMGGVAVPITAGLGAVVRGVTDPIRQRLADAGVAMTPGQILGGAWQTIENGLTHIPVLGDTIKNAQRRAVQSFNRATYQNALDPIGVQMPGNIGAGSDGVAYVRNQIGNVYNGIEPRASFVADQNFQSDLSAIRNSLSQEAPGALPQFDAIVQNQITGKLNNGAMNGTQWGDTRSMIDRFARNQIRGDASPDQWALNGALGDLNSAVNGAVGRSSAPDVLADLSRANQAYAQYKQIERAAGMKTARDSGNIFTPAQYSGAVGNGATAFQKATNSGLNGQMATDAQSVLGQKYPDSGTVGRSLLTLGLGALAGHASPAAAAVVPSVVGIGLGSLPYTTLGQRVAQGLLMNRPAFAQPLGNAISGGLAPLMPGLLGAFAR